MSDHFKNDDDCGDDQDAIDDGDADGVALHVSRERVQRLRDNLLNMLPHYFNRHDGELFFSSILSAFHRQCYLQAVGFGVRTRTLTTLRKHTKGTLG